MKVTVLPAGAAKKSGLYPASKSFAGLRTGQSSSRKSGGKRRNKTRNGCNSAAGQLALAEYEAKQAAARARVIAIEEAAGIFR